MNKWQLAFNPNVVEGSWVPINSTPDFEASTSYRTGVIQKFIDNLCSQSHDFEFDKIVLLLPQGLHESDFRFLSCKFGTDIRFLSQGYENLVHPDQQLSYLDFEDWAISETLCTLVQSDETTLVVSAFLLESLLDSRPLLRSVRKALRINRGNRLLNLTFNWNPTAQPWQATNQTEHVFISAMQDSGFHLENLSTPTSSCFEGIYGTRIQLFSCSSNHYRNFLNEIGVAENTRTLNVTTESVHLPRTGGIGKYCENFDLSETPSIFLLAVSGSGLNETTRTKNLWVDVDGFEANVRSGQLPYDEVLLSCLQILFIFDEIELIEYQDYLGIGYRIAQAKQSGLIPRGVTLNCVAHGNQYYLQSGFDEFARTEQHQVPVYERVSAELADSVVFATEFLQDMYSRELGWRLKSFSIRPYPNSIQGATGTPVDKRITTIVFLGKDTVFKGFNIFVEAIKSLEENDDLSREGITDLLVLGTESPREELTSITSLSARFEYPNAELLTERIKQLSPHSLFVLPYQGDNSPLMVQEVIKNASRYLFGNAGGIPEVIPPELRVKLVDLDVGALAARILREITEPVETPPSSGIVHEYYQKQNHEFNSYFTQPGQQNGVRPEADGDSDISVIVTMYNPTEAEVLDCIRGINNQATKPFEVIFADDCSTDENFAQTESLIRLNLLARYRLVRQEVNLGLAACRNLGLKSVKTAFFLTLDIDDVLHPRYIRRLEQAFSTSDADIVTSGSKYFVDGSDFRKIFRSNQGHYLPTSESLTLSLTGNSIGHACAGYRTSYMRQMGGWDESSRAMWEDWQLFLKCVLAGGKFALIPELMLFYRVRPDSMTRTHRRLPAYQRIMSELTFIPESQRFEFLAALVSARRISDSPKVVFLQAAGAEGRKNLTNELLALLSYHSDYQPVLFRMREIFRFVKKSLKVVASLFRKPPS